MARLPSVSNNPVLTQAPRPGVSGADIANPYRQIADAFGEVGTLLQEQQIKRASEAGAAGVYRDQAGDLKVDLRPDWTKTGDAYNRAAVQAYTARLAGDIRSRGTALANDAQGNVDTFASSWKGFSDKLLQGVPDEARGAVAQMLDQEQSRLGLGVSEQKRTRDIKVFEGNIKAEIASLDDEMSALARGGGTNTPDYQQKQAQLKSLYGELASNPEFAVGENEAAIAIKRMESRHLAEATVGHVEKTLATGGYQAAKAEAERLLTDTNLSLSPAERRQYSGLANEAIRGWAAQKKLELQPWKDKSTKLQGLLDEGLGIDNGDIDETAMALARGGDSAGALELYAARARARTIQSFRQSGNQDQVAALERGVAAANGVDTRQRGDKVISGSAGEQAASLLRGFEGFRSSTYHDVNHERVGYGSDTITRPDGTVVTVTKGMTVSKADAERDLARRISKTEQDARSKIGAAAWDALPANAKAGIISTAYNYGEVPDRIVGAIRSGDPSAIAAAVAGLGGDNGGVNAKRRAKEASIIAGGGAIDVDPAVIKEMRQEVTSDAKSLWGDMKAGMDKNMPPSADEVNLLTRQLALVDDEDFRRQVTQYFEVEGGKLALSEMPRDQADAIISALKSQAADGATIAQQDLITGLQRSQEQRAAALKADPVGYAVDHKYIEPVPTIDLAGGPEAIGSAFAARQRGVDLLRARGDVGNVSALRPEDEIKLGQFLQKSTPAEQGQLLGSMARTLKPDTFMATMSSLSAKGDTKAMAAAGALYQDNPGAAEGILRGQQLLRENAKLAPASTDKNTQEIDGLLPSTAFAPAMEGSRQQLLDAATARYADLSNLSGDTSGELNGDRMNQAVQEVTGGMLDMNGSKTIAPRYGMTQGEFDTAISNLSNGDLAGAVTADGEPITPRDLRTYGRLKAVGAGQYALEFGPEGYAPSYAMARPDFGDRSQRVQRGIFILDLSKK